MTPNDVPHRLKALREAAGLTIRELAHRLDKSSSGYAHYENPERFKADYLPMKVAQDIARILAPLGVPAEQVMALAGARAAPRSTAAEPQGFAEDAARPWSPAGDDRQRIEAAVNAIAPGAGNPGTFMVARRIPELGLIEGDIIVVDRKRLPRAGELALGNADDGSGQMVTVIGRYLPPILFTSDSLTTGKVFDVTDGSVAVYHPIVGSFRRTSPA